LRNIHTDFGVH